MAFSLTAYAQKQEKKEMKKVLPKIRSTLV
jgi:hypothetical protein